MKRRRISKFCIIAICFSSWCAVARARMTLRRIMLSAWIWHKRLATEPGNIFVSPLSIRTALGMACLGARGRTAEQMARVLYLPPVASNSLSVAKVMMRKS